MEERRCLRCGAPYEEGATVCFSCGASIGELETPTQPVRAPKRPEPPTDATQANLTDAVHSSEVERATPIATQVAAQWAAPQLASRPLTVGSHYPWPAAPAPRPRRRWPLILALVVVALLVGLGVAGVVGLRALRGGATTAKATIYHDPQGRFSFTTPSLWTVTPRADGALLADSAGVDTVSISVAKATAGQTAGAIAAAQGAAQGLQPGAATLIGGDTWQQETGQITGSDGATRQITLYVDVHAGQSYIITCSSPTSVYNNTNTLIYQPLLASFTFAK